MPGINKFLVIFAIKLYVQVKITLFFLWLLLGILVSPKELFVVFLGVVPLCLIHEFGTGILFQPILCRIPGFGYFGFVVTLFSHLS